MSVKRLRLLGMCLVPALLVFCTQAGAAGRQQSNVKLVHRPVWTLAMDWPQVAYTSGEDGKSEELHVWNMATGATSVIESKHGVATHDAGEIAISGKRLAWIRTVQVGNTELNHWLYTASLGGSAHLLRQMHGFTDTDCGLGGPQMGGLVGSGKAMAVSTWTDSSDGSVSSKQRLSLITRTGLRTIATGPNAILSESADGGHIAVLPSPPPSMTPDSCEQSLPTSAAVYSTDGTLLGTIELPPPDPSTLVYQVALSGNELVVLTDGLYEPNGPAWVMLTVYDWTTGAMLHTWPVGITYDPGEVDFSVHGELAAVEGPSRLHLVDLNTGKDVTIAAARQIVSPTSLGAHGLIYAVDRHNRGKLVFVPWAKLLAAVS
jgi:hypothetical protein